MHANPAKAVGEELASFEQYIETFLAWKTKQMMHAHGNIQRTQAAQKKGHDKCIRYNREFVSGNMVAYCKEKKCQKKGKFWAQYVGPYTVFKIDKKTHKLELRPTKVKVATIDFMVPTFDVVHCTLDLNLTKINLVGREITYVPKKKLGNLSQAEHSIREDKDCEIEE